MSVFDSGNGQLCQLFDSISLRQTDSEFTLYRDDGKRDENQSDGGTSFMGFQINVFTATTYY